ncbi:MAG: hypothetical protein HFE63_10860 [Clostridiales bacterium]|nr:hypothetical protein [Clostridiales bacterium]
MPRLAKTQAEKQQESILRWLDIYTGERSRAGSDSETIARSLGFAYSTLYKRRKNPWDFTLAELQRMANVMNITISTLLGENKGEIAT